MSFDIFFQPCRFGLGSIEQTNPFTKKSTKVLPNEPLTAAELLAVRSVLEDSNGPIADQFGCNVIHFEDGGYAEVHGKDLQTGCMVALRGSLSKKVVEFLFDLLRAGNWVMIPAMEDTRAIATSTTTLRNIPKGFPPTMISESATELEIFLTRGFDAWKKYRDQIVGKPLESQDQRGTGSQN